MGTLIFPYIRRLGQFLGVQNLEFQYFGVFRKNNIFFRYEDYVDIFFFFGGGHLKYGLVLGVISMHFRIFS